MKKQGCEHHILAQGVVAQVEYCVYCAVFHVSMESLTVRFRPTALRDLRDTLTAALAAQQQLARETSVHAPVPVDPGHEVH